MPASNLRMPSSSLPGSARPKGARLPCLARPPTTVCQTSETLHWEADLVCFVGFLFALGRPGRVPLRTRRGRRSTFWSRCGCWAGPWRGPTCCPACCHSRVRFARSPRPFTDRQSPSLRSGAQRIFGGHSRSREPGGGSRGKQDLWSPLVSNAAWVRKVSSLL